MFKSAERKRSQGFTLAEVLIVVAIIGILLAVAIPNVISYYRSLKLTELDDSAKTIFMAAQSRLTAMTSAGEDLYALSTVEVNEKPDPGVGTGRFLAVTSEQADSLASIVPGGSIESQLYDNHYVVEIDPKTGAVYAVWYWEKEDFKYTSDAYVKVPSDKGERLKKGAMVGYYGGSEINRPDLGQMPIPQLTVINAEELRLEIRIPDLKLDSSSGFDKTNIRVSVLINGKTIIDSRQLGDVDVKDTTLQKNYVGKVILDTLKSGNYTQEPQSDAADSGWNFGWVAGAKFEDWVNDKGIGAVPGDDINVTVVVSYLGTVKIKGKDTSLVSQSATVHTNSLFASVEEDSVTGEPVTAEIAYGRHLQNLDTATSGVTNTITAAEQTRSIDFHEYTSVTGVYSWKDTYGSMFKPIENASLTSYNGHEYEIRNLNIENTYTDPNERAAASLGLFGFLSNYDDTIKFENIILVNTKSEEGFNVGALVGALVNGYIDDCHVYLDEIRADGKLRDPNPRLKGSYVGGLVGMAFEDLTITNCSAATVISSTGNAGGLVSNVAWACKISKSYAACNLTGAYVGGLVGLGTGGVTIQNSYAAGTADVIDDASKSREVAGLVNWDEGTVGAIEPEVTNSYAAVRYGKSVTDALASGSLKIVFGACEITPDMTASSKVSELYYVKQAGITYEGNSGDALSVSEFKDMVGKPPFNNSDYWYVPGGATVNPRGLTTPYKVLDSWLADPYPYPMLANNITAVDGTPIPMPHYGDWLENSYATSFYWEQENGAYHFYLVLSDGATKYVADGLCPDHHLTADMGQDIDAWGYGLIGIDAAAVNTAGLNASIDTANKSTVFDQLKTFLGIGVTPPYSIPWEGSAPGTDTLKGITDLLSDDSNVILLQGASQDDFQTIETGAGWLELNLGFAAAIDVTENTGTKPSEATHMGKARATGSDNFPYQIRTAQQLDNIPDGSQTDPHKGCYEQTHDINGSDYVNAPNTPKYDGADYFGGTYNGNSYRILELSVDGSGGAHNSRKGGLFAGLQGATLENIILYSPSGNATIKGNPGNTVGGLALAVQGSSADDTEIHNCVVAGYTITLTTDTSSSVLGLGGLVGGVHGGDLEIINSSAVNTLTVNGTDGERDVGGLVGEARSGTLKIENSYAGGKIESSANNVGGIVAAAKTGFGDCTYENVYSYVNMKNVTATSYYGIGPASTTGGASGYTGDCQYWTAGLGSGHTASDPTDVTGVSLAQLESGVTAKAEHTYRPGSTLPEGLEDLNDRTQPSTNDPYPYPAVVTVPVSAYDPNNTTGATVPVHYGEWPVIEASATYVEIYQDNNTSATTYGLYGYLSDTNTQINTLKTDLTGVSLIDDCYGLLVPAGDPCPDVIPVNDGTLEPVMGPDDKPIKVENICDYTPTGGTKVEYDFYRYKFVAPGVTSTGYYHSVTLNKQEFWVNLDYGCEVVKAPAGVTVTTAEPQSKPGAAGFGSTDPAGNFNEKVVLRTARQLAKMAEATKSVGDENNAAQLRKYEQLLDIDYSAYTGLNNSFTTGKNADNAQTPAALWRTTTATGSTVSGVYNGNSHIIRNLYIKGSGNNVGLFGVIGTSSNNKIQNIFLVDVHVDGDGCDNVGALVGNASSATSIDNCGVYVSADKAGDYANYVVKGKTNVGGLIGQVGGSTYVTNSFAAVKVEGENCVGGFAGQINGSKGMENCYSGGHTENGEYKDTSINVTATIGSAGGFVGKLMNYQNDSSATPKQANSFILNGVLYSTCSVSGTDDKTGLFAGEISDWTKLPGKTDGTAIEPVLNGITNYGLGTAFKKGGTGYTPTTPREETYLTKPTVTAKGSGFKTHPYDLPTLEGKDYPYQTNLNEHYGDWVMPKFQVSGYIYWELEGGAYHYSVTAWDREKGAATWDELSIGSTLCNEYDTKGISNYGYGWFYAGDFDGSGPTMTDASGGTEDTSAKGALESSLKTALETALPGVDLGTVTVEAYSYNSTNASGTTQTWTIRHGTETLQTATLNPDFADTVTTDGTVATPYKVRTIRQLRNINHTAYLAQSFTQGHDLDGDGVTDYAPIGNGTGDFTGHYDGKGYRIRNLDISVAGEDACAGLFGRASGSANFERIIMWGNNNTISASDSSGTLIKNSRARVGGIVAEIPSGSVTISNCVVAGYRLEASATGNIFCTSENVYVGGIVANLNGTVENCEAVVNITNNSGSAYIGGLVGEIGSGSVTNSYAGGSVTTSDTTCVGGLVGKAASDNQITNSFSYVTGAHYAIDGNGRTHNSCAYFGDTFANNRDNDAQQCASVTALTNWLISNATFHYAEYVYDGSGEVSGATFNGAVVEVPGPDGDPVYVHYGDLPA